MARRRGGSRSRGQSRARPRGAPTPQASGRAGSGRRPPRAALIGGILLTTAALLILSAGQLGFVVPRPSATALPTFSLATDAPTLTPAPSAAGSAAPSGASAAPAISGIQCDVAEGTTLHVHSHLNIRLDGQLQTIPADIGILPTCTYWLHTHAAFGIIHVEAPAAGTYTLGQFFDVWGKTLSSTQILDRTIGANEHLYVFVDRKPYQGDPRQIELGNLVAIELQVGPAPLDPLPYTFPANFE